MSGTNVKYFSVSHDEEKFQREAILKGLPWTFINLLPIKINVWVYTPMKMDLVGTIAPQSKLVALEGQTGLKLEEGYEIHVTYPDYPGDCGKKGIWSGPEYEICRPEFLFSDSRMVRIGDAVNEAKSTDYTQRTHTDITGIRVHNHLTIPLGIYHKGNKIGRVAGDDGTDAPFSGSPGSVYLSNDSNGFRIGDCLDFVFENPRLGYCTVTIHDNYISDMYIGNITQHYVPTIKDYYSYRVDTPNITGLRYFESTTGYQSIPSM